MRRYTHIYIYIRLSHCPINFQETETETEKKKEMKRNRTIKYDREPNRHTCIVFVCIRAHPHLHTSAIIDLHAIPLNQNVISKPTTLWLFLQTGSMNNWNWENFSTDQFFKWFSLSIYIFDTVKLSKIFPDWLSNASWHFAYFEYKHISYSIFKSWSCLSGEKNEWWE